MKGKKEKKKKSEVLEKLLVWRLCLGNWRSCFLRQLHDLELEVVWDFHKRIQEHLVNQNGKDSLSLVWNDSNEGKFLVKSF